MGTSASLIVRTAEKPGHPSRPTEDRIFTTDTAVVLLDGATDRKNLDRTGGWMAQQVGERLQRVLLAEPASKVAVELEAIIIDLAEEFDLRPGQAPSTTLSVLRLRDGFIDVFVLADSPVLVQTNAGRIVEVRDDRLAAVGAKFPRPAGAFNREDPAWVERSDWIESRRNHSDGFWTVAASPEAAHQMTSYTIPLTDFKAALMMSDGASILYDRYEPGGWQLGFDLMYNDPVAAIERTTTIEQSDPACSRWPRSKIHDDKAIAAISIEDPR